MIIAHRLSTIRDCDRIMVFDKGNLVEFASHDDLIKMNGVYRKLMERQLVGQKLLTRDIADMDTDDSSS